MEKNYEKSVFIFADLTSNLVINFQALNPVFPPFFHRNSSERVSVETVNSELIPFREGKLPLHAPRKHQERVYMGWESYCSKTPSLVRPMGL